MWGGFSGISSLRSHNSVQGSLSPRDLLVSLAQFRSRIPLSSGFRRFAHAIPFENSSLLGICSLRSHNSVQESLSLLGICSFHSHNSVQESLSLLGISSLRSHNSVQESLSLLGICSFHSHNSVQESLSLLGICSFHSHNSVQEYLSPRDFVASLTQFRSRIPLSSGFRRFAHAIPFENSSLLGICSLRSHNSVQEYLSLRDFVASLRQFRSSTPLSSGFRRFAHTIPFKNPSLSSGFARFTRTIPFKNPSLSSGFARFTRTIPFKNTSLSGISSLRSDIPPRLRRGDAKHKKKWRSSELGASFLFVFCGERGIRTLDTLLAYTRFPGVPLQPLEHLSVGVQM
jgi:hypothetical protein